MSMFLLDVGGRGHCVLHSAQQKHLARLFDIQTFNRFRESLQRRFAYAVMVLHDCISNLALEVIHSQLAIVKVEFALGLRWLVENNSLRHRCLNERRKHTLGSAVIAVGRRAKNVRKMGHCLVEVACCFLFVGWFSNNDFLLCAFEVDSLLIIIIYYLLFMRMPRTYYCGRKKKCFFLWG